MYVLRFAVIAFVVAAICACGTAPPGQARSTVGDPEVMIANVAKTQVLATIISAGRRAGMQVLSLSEHEVTLSKPIARSMDGPVRETSRILPMQDAELTYRLADVAGGTRVSLRAAMITNPGSANERITDATPALANRLRSDLEALRAVFAR